MLQLIRILVFSSLLLFLLLLLLLVGAEVYLRHTTTTITPNKSDATLLLENNAELLVRQTPHGRRLIPNADVLIKNHRLSKKDISMHINSSGFRDHELAQEKKENEIRILVLGDSITWGDYLQADEVYVEHIEQSLKAAFPNKIIEVINGGVGDIGLKEELDILKEQGLAVQPDLVFIAFYLNDSRPPWGFPRELEHRGFLRRHSVLAETIYRNLVFLQWLQLQGESRFSWIYSLNSIDWRTRAGFLRLAKLAEYDWGAAWEPKSWESIKQYFEQLRVLSLEHHFSVGVVVFPVAFQVYMQEVENEPQLRLQQLAEQSGFLFYDLLPVFRQHNQEELFFDHCHPMEKANAFIGQEIANFLMRNPFLPTK